MRNAHVSEIQCFGCNIQPVLTIGRVKGTDAHARRVYLDYEVPKQHV